MSDDDRDKTPAKRKDDKPRKDEKKEESTSSKRKHAYTHEELVKIATTFPSPDDSLLFHSEVATQKNVLIVGKAGVGKTTLFEVLKNPGYQTPMSYSFFASGPKEACYTPLIVRNGAGKAFSINVIDTPGICEIRSSMSERRTNDQIIKIIQDCVLDKVTFLSAIFLAVPIGVLNEEDIQVLNTMKTLLVVGDSFKKNTMLVFTHAEKHQLSTLTERVKEFLGSEISQPFLDFCQGGIHFSGALNGELCHELGDDYEEVVRNKVTCLRQNLLEAIMNSTDVKVEFGGNSTHAHEEKKPHPNPLPVPEQAANSPKGIVTTPSKRANEMPARRDGGK